MNSRNVACNGNELTTSDKGSPSAFQQEFPASEVHQQLSEALPPHLAGKVKSVRVQIINIEYELK